MPIHADEHRGEDAAGLRDLVGELSHAAELWTRQPGLGKVRHGLRQVHQTVCDQVGPGQVHEEDVCGPKLRSGFGKRAQTQPTVPYNTSEAEERSRE